MIYCEVAKAILSAKNVPYIVAAPLLIQDIASWQKSGIGGLQSVILYALPELDGAIDTVPLGGLVGDDIYLTRERVYALAGRLIKWVSLRRKPAAERTVAVMLYGFPPGVGATVRIGSDCLLVVYLCMCPLSPQSPSSQDKFPLTEADDSPFAPPPTHQVGITHHSPIEELV